MINQNFIDIKEASILTNKSFQTLRRLIKKKEVGYQMIKNTYYINKNELSKIYPFVINQTSENLQNETNQMNTFDLWKHIQPLLDSIVYHQEKVQELQKLLTQWESKIKEKEEKINKEITRLKTQKKILFWLIIWIVLIFIVFILIDKGFLIINF